MRSELQIASDECRKLLEELRAVQSTPGTSLGDIGVAAARYKEQHMKLWGLVMAEMNAN